MMAVKKGTLSIDSENIFPIIKKWVYSDHDIFVREMISNGCDAITKLKKLDMMGEYELPEDYKPKIEVIVNPEEKTMKFIDNGLGMTADEVEEYITQIAFSGATQFLEKYKDKTTEDDMIGHFGLGFYSAFMVADEVQIDTLSYKEGAAPVHWASQGGTEYEMQEGNKTTVGSEITLYLNEESLEFANEYRAREVLEKYCSFMPVEIFLSKANAEPQYETISEDELLDTDTVIEHIEEPAKDSEEKEGKTYIVDPVLNAVLDTSLTLKAICIILRHPLDILKLFRTKQLKLHYGHNFIKEALKTAIFYKEYSRIFGRELIMKSTYITQESMHYKVHFKTDAERLAEAERLVKMYAKAQLVITSRIHCALPCLGLETPVIYLEKGIDIEESKCRLGGLKELFNVITVNNGTLIPQFDTMLPITELNRPSNKDTWRSLANELKRRCKDFISD